MDEEIRPMEPKGLEMIPPRRVKPAPVEPIVIEDAVIAPDDRVSFTSIFLLWIRENLINDILQSKQGVPMEPTKLWYASKTLWVNFLTLVWMFVGPMIGIPTLSPELMLVLLGAINAVLRIITKQEVVLS